MKHREEVQRLETLNFTPKQARLHSGKTQSEVAAGLGICLATYRKLEENPEKMTIAHAKVFSKIVGIPINSIFFCRRF